MRNRIFGSADGRSVLHAFALPMLIVPVLALCVATASAAPRTANQTVAENGAYFWVDGVYQQVNLPTYRLGFHNAVVPGPIVDLGPMQSFQPRADGGGVRAAIGYAIPGTGTRIEFGGSHVEAKDVQSQSTVPVTGGAPLLLMTGAGVNTGLNCQAGLVCTIAGTLGTEYRAWQFSGKIETDWRSGGVTITPSLEAFGGNARVNQTLLQRATQTNFGVPLGGFTTYAASSTLEWRDIGARAGLHLSAAVTPAFSVGIGGSIGAASRNVSFAGRDSGNSSSPLLIAGTSTFSLGDNKAVLLANAEAGIALTVAPGATVHGFAGLNYDGDVPGIGAPSYGGIIQAPTSRSAAGIIYESQTSYYAGGGLRVSFGGARP